MSLFAKLFAAFVIGAMCGSAATFEYCAHRAENMVKTYELTRDTLAKMSAENSRLQIDLDASEAAGEAMGKQAVEEAGEANGLRTQLDAAGQSAQRLQQAVLIVNSQLSTCRMVARNAQAQAAATPVSPQMQQWLQLLAKAVLR